MKYRAPGEDREAAVAKPEDTPYTGKVPDRLARRGVPERTVKQALEATRGPVRRPRRVGVVQTGAAPEGKEVPRERNKLSEVVRNPKVAARVRLESSRRGAPLGRDRPGGAQPKSRDISGAKNQLQIAEAQIRRALCIGGVPSTGARVRLGPPAS